MESTIIDIIKAGYLERTINGLIDKIPHTVRRLRDTGGKNHYNYTSEKDFVYGCTFGWIVSKCEDLLMLAKDEKLDEKEYQELSEVVDNKLQLIREKISEVGEFS
jgi:hypothetical protein